MVETVWECSCGQIEYGDLPPEECSSCFKIDSFTQLPEELALEREKDKVEEFDMPENPVKVKPVKNRTSRSLKKSTKSKVKTSGRKKKR